MKSQRALRERQRGPGCCPSATPLSPPSPPPPTHTPICPRTPFCSGLGIWFWPGIQATVDLTLQRADAPHSCRHGNRAGVGGTAVATAPSAPAGSSKASVPHLSAEAPKHFLQGQLEMPEPPGQPGVWSVCGFPTTTANSRTPTRCPVIPLGSDTDHPESARTHGLRAQAHKSTPNFRRQEKVPGHQATHTAAQGGYKFWGAHKPLRFDNSLEQLGTQESALLMITGLS